ncbi:M23 family metallopeptidase [candidate division KSB1 bacterium]
MINVFNLCFVKAFFGRKAFCAAFVMMIFAFSMNAAAQQNYIWPTDASSLLTSIFGEYRPDRLHAGIDIKTWNRTGYKALAVDDGYVMRIRVSPFGYGRSVYIRLKTGEIAVYAHLSRFSPEITRLVAEEQRRTQRFSVDIWLTSGRLPVKQGETIAYTGRSGSRLPHLHFELRDTNNLPVNPLAHGFTATDHAPPVPLKLSISPVTVNSHVNFDWAPVIQSLKRVNLNEYLLPSPVNVWGEIVLGLDAYDVNGEYDNLYGIYRLQLFLNGREVHSVQFDRFDYEQNKLVNLDRDYRLLRNDTGKFYNLYVKEGNSLNFYGGHKTGDGVLRFSGQENADIPFEIRLTDYYDNQSSVNGVFHAQSYSDRIFGSSGISQGVSSDIAAQTDTLNRKSPGQFQVREEYYDTFLRLSFRAGTDLQSPPKVEIVHDGKILGSLKARAISRRNFIAAVPFEQVQDKKVTITIEGESATHLYDSSVPVELVYIPPGGKRIELKNGAGFLEFERGDLYRGLWFRQAVDSNKSDSPEYDIAGDIVRLSPKEVPLRSSVQVTLNYGDDDPQPEKLAVYAQDNEGTWHYIGHEPDSYGRTTATSLSSLETVSLIRDVVPPEIFDIQPDEESRITDTTPEIAVWFDDELSGISDEDDIQLFIDGRKIIAEWDPILEKIFYTPAQVLGPGVHTVRFTARDRMENYVEKEWQFTIQ